MLDVFLTSWSGPREVGVSDLVVKSAADGKPVSLKRVEVARADGSRSVLALAPGELPALEEKLAEDRSVAHWTVSDQEFTFEEGGE